MPASDSTEFVDSALVDTERAALLALARASIAYGLVHGTPLTLTDMLTTPLAAWQQQPGACFVTLKQNAVLRGCIGSLQARHPLARNVSDNAFAAAFRDHRFPPLSAAELPQIRLEISVLSTPEPLAPVASEAALLAQLRPGIDGVVVEQASRRATYLPDVWLHFANGAAFLRSLRQKAGLAADFDAAARYSRYQVTRLAEP